MTPAAAYGAFKPLSASLGEHPPNEMRNARSSTAGRGAIHLPDSALTLDSRRPRTATARSYSGGQSRPTGGLDQLRRSREARTRSRAPCSRYWRPPDRPLRRALRAPAAPTASRLVPRRETYDVVKGAAPSPSRQVRVLVRGALGRSTAHPLAETCLLQDQRPASRGSYRSSVIQDVFTNGNDISHVLVI